MSVFHSLSVGAIREEIGGQAKTVIFDVPEDLAGTFRWRAGQHVTLRFDLAGREERRSYSISASPVSGPLQITVKRVEGGLVSNHINDRIVAGDRIDIMPPFGGFCLDPDKSARRTCYFLAGGSGITPLIAMVQALLAAEPYSTAHLVFGNRNAASILFRVDLENLAARHRERLTVSHVLSAADWLSSFSPWRRGHIDEAAIEALFAELPPYAQDVQYFVCGPGAMNGSVRGALMNLDVPAGRIHMESFGGVQVDDDGVEGLAAQVQVTLAGTTHAVRVAAGQTLLESLRAHKLDPPFSCQSGVCGACRAQLTSGEVHMRSRSALEDSDVDAGAILTCQSVARSKALAIAFDG